MAVNLTAEFDAMIAALKHCLRIRNKYAHAYWHDPNMGKNLCYVSLEELAGRYNSGALRQQIFPLPAVVAPPPYYTRST